MIKAMLGQLRAALASPPVQAGIGLGLISWGINSLMDLAIAQQEEVETLSKRAAVARQTLAGVSRQIARRRAQLAAMPPAPLVDEQAVREWAARQERQPYEPVDVLAGTGSMSEHAGDVAQAPADAGEVAGVPPDDDPDL